MQRPRREFIDSDVVGSFCRHHDEGLAGLQILEIPGVSGFELVIEGQSMWNVGGLNSHDG
jgi:hypothetical protein